MSPLRVKFIGTPVITYVRRYAPPLLILASSLIAGCGGLSAPAEGPRASLAAGPASRAPVSVNSPLSPAAEIRGQKIDGPAPLASDAPRVGPPAAGQVVAEDYRIGPQDLIEVQVYGLEGLKREVRVNSRGVISLPLIGTVALGGLTAQEGEELITMKYEKDYLRNPQVSLFIKEFTSQRITIEGAVNKPGVFPIKGQTSLLQALAIAGGGAAMSDMTAIMLFRVENGTKKTMKYDITKIRSGVMEDPMLMNDDLVVVNRSEARTALKDSLFRDILDTLNPFSYIKPY